MSEVMLQQTQVDRVVPKYRTFLKRFPTVGALAQAPLGEVLRVWQGLGYNRRAKLLWQCAREIDVQHQGRFPRQYDELKALPGVGPYTAGALLAFAYNEAVPLIETNVRTVFLYHFWPLDATKVHDAEILALVRKTLPTENVRGWYAAIMDYGSHLKKTVGNHNVRARSYQKQRPFAGSDRQLRGAILRTLVAGPTTRMTLQKVLATFSSTRIEGQLDVLVREGLIEKRRQRFALPT